MPEHDDLASVFERISARQESAFRDALGILRDEVRELRLETARSRESTVELTRAMQAALASSMANMQRAVISSLIGVALVSMLVVAAVAGVSVQTRHLSLTPTSAVVASP
jgi:hypothetical protein